MCPPPNSKTKSHPGGDRSRQSPDVKTVRVNRSSYGGGGDSPDSSPSPYASSTMSDGDDHGVVEPQSDDHLPPPFEGNDNDNQLAQPQFDISEQRAPEYLGGNNAPPPSAPLPAKGRPRAAATPELPMTAPESENGQDENAQSQGKSSTTTSTTSSRKSHPETDDDNTSTDEDAKTSPSTSSSSSTGSSSSSSSDSSDSSENVSDGSPPDTDTETSSSRTSTATTSSRDSGRRAYAKKKSKKRNSSARMLFRALSAVLTDKYGNNIVDAINGVGDKLDNIDMKLGAVLFQLRGSSM